MRARYVVTGRTKIGPGELDLIDIARYFGYSDFEAWGIMGGWDSAASGLDRHWVREPDRQDHGYTSAFELGKKLYALAPRA